MKKFMVIIILAALQVACAAPAPVRHGDAPLLGFSELASEIRVGVETAMPEEPGALPDDRPLGTP